MDALGAVFTVEWFRWLATLEVLGIAALPLSMALFWAFPDRGYGLSKVLGLLLLSFVNWWIGSVAGAANYPLLLWILVICLLVGNVYACLRWRPEILRGFRANLRVIAWSEALFLLAFFVWSLVRAQSPDIYSTEKPMDFMLLQVSGNAHSFPPPDAWLSGHTVNYYYLGYAIFAMLGRLAAVDPRFGFNLSNITVFAAGCSGAFTLVLALTKKITWGISGVFALMLAGNLDGVAQFVGQIRSGGPDESGLNLWCSTRVVEGGCTAYHAITEFPIFSVLWNDLHPHLMAIPFVLLAIGFGIHALCAAGQREHAPIARYAILLATAMSLGALFPINSWDYPTYTIFTIGAFLLALRRDAITDTKRILEVVAIVPGSILLYLPYYLTVHSKAGLGLRANPISLGDTLTILGGLFIPAVLLVLWRGYAALASPDKDRDGQSRTARILFALPAGAGWWTAFAFAILLFVWPARTDLVLVLVLIIGSYVIARRPLSETPASLACIGLILTAAAVLLLGDFGYLTDLFAANDNYRMNTIFKLFYQAWLLLALSAAYGVFAITSYLQAAGRRNAKFGWLGLCAIGALGLAIYPVEGVGSIARGMSLSTTLDGLAYVRDIAPDEYAVVAWVRGHTQPFDVVAEGYGADYWTGPLAQAANVVSALSGRPTIIGWPGSHESLWRGDFGAGADAAAAGAMLSQREADVRLLYTTTDRAVAETILKRYNVRYVFVSDAEIAEFTPSQAAIDKFTAFLRPVVQRPTATLYAVPGSLASGF